MLGETIESSFQPNWNTKSIVLPSHKEGEQKTVRSSFLYKNMSMVVSRSPCLIGYVKEQERHLFRRSLLKNTRCIVPSKDGVGIDITSLYKLDSFK